MKKKKTVISKQKKGKLLTRGVQRCGEIEGKVDIVKDVVKLN